MKNIENSVGIVTGAGAGLGKVIAILFAGAGGKLITVSARRQIQDCRN